MKLPMCKAFADHDYGDDENPSLNIGPLRLNNFSEENKSLQSYKLLSDVTEKSPQVPQNIIDEQEERGHLSSISQEQDESMIS